MFVLYVIAAVLFLFKGSNGEVYNYVERYFDQKIDHFNFLSYGNQTYKQRYLYNDTWWQKGRGPIFFYAGNEDEIVNFWRNTGFIFRAAQTFNALVVFAEHRYFGKSLPFGNDSFMEPHLGLMSLDQTLADYAFFLKGFKREFKAEDCPVIAFGGSYGGVLAAFMRFKYPNIITGAIAASAPIYLQNGELDLGVYFQAITKVFRLISNSCVEKVRSAFSQLQKWANMGPSGLNEISQTFHLCKALKNQADYDHLLRWSRDAFSVATMMNYPYPSTFMGNFPAFPVKVMCERLESATRPADGLFAATALLYNGSHTVDCFDIYGEYVYCSDQTGCGLGTDSIAWDYLTCTEVSGEGGTNGVDDMFPVLPFNSSMRDEYCFKKFRVVPRRDILDVVYWGKDISSSSNIVFSNGNLDPCTTGGILHDLSDTLVTVMVDGGAHHLDLREDHPNDPLSVRYARQFEIENIRKWLDAFYNK